MNERPRRHDASSSASDGVEAALDSVARELLRRRAAPDHWEGFLSSSALSTATAVLALAITAQHDNAAAARLIPKIVAGRGWLVRHQNADGGWGDTVRSRSNISTTAIVWSTLSATAKESSEVETAAPSAVERAQTWLTRAAGGTDPKRLRAAILARYGKDRTFSVPILMVLALTGKLGEGAAAWRSIPQLPFELAAVPHGWFQHLRLPVVSYALPALIAIGQVRHHFAPSRNPIARALRTALRERTRQVLREMQPESGGYLEAAPLTSFVVMSLSAMGTTSSPVAKAGLAFLLTSMRGDGSWPIDTNLSTWVTTLSVGALAAADRLPEADADSVVRWLLAQQSTSEHRFTHAAAGAWAWTPLSGGVPDADDTSGVLVALSQLRRREAAGRAAAGVRWLLGMQNRDGGIPTFCRGWGALPFDRSTPEITAHALLAWSAWMPHLDRDQQSMVQAATQRALGFLVGSQRPDGSWIPLWFGNEQAGTEENPTYGTARVVPALLATRSQATPAVAESLRRAIRWLLEAQNDDGGWGGQRGIRSTIEETGVAVAALGSASVLGDGACRTAVERGAAWLVDATGDPGKVTASPIGLYFARLWYYEELYPLVFALSGLASAQRFRQHSASALR
jgi:squalene-hopene/tetraprenyl-beta-curcumene cyclase